MATKRSIVLFLSFFLAIQFTLFLSAGSANCVHIEDPGTSEFADSALKIELNQLKLKISTLESSIKWTENVLESKEGRVTQLEKTIQEKLGKIALLQSEIESLQEKRSRNDKEKVGVAQTTISEIERQVENLKKEVQTQGEKKKALEARSNIAEGKMQQLNSKLQDLQKINDEQRTTIRKTEKALQFEEEELLKTKMDVASISKDYRKIDRAGLRHWCVVHMLYFQNLGVAFWKAYGRSVAEKTLDAMDDLLRLAIPCLKTFMKDFMPEEDMDQLMASFKHHLEKAHATLDPYTKRASAAYRRFMKSVMAYHWQLQAAIREKLSKTRFMEYLQVDEVAKLAATVLMALPIFILLHIFLARLRKPKKQVCCRQSHHLES